MTSPSGPSPALIPPLNTDPQTGERLAIAFLTELFAGQERGRAVIFSIPDNQARFFDISIPGWESMAARTAMMLRDTRHTYIGVCSLQQEPHSGGRGTEADVLSVPGLWADIDILGPAHASNKLPPSADAVRKFLASLPFAPTLTVYSGHGMYAYWLFREPLEITGPEERKYARALVGAYGRYIRRRAADRGWKLDTVDDLARVLRLPGTFNRKLEDDVRLVTYEPTINALRYSPSDFEDFLDFGPEPANSESGSTAPGELAADFALISQGCSWVKHCIADAATLPEPEWYRVVGVAARCNNGRAIAHELSRDYPKYSPAETDKKFDQSLVRSRATTCRYIAEHFDNGEYCRQCQHAGRINSPVALSYPKRTAVFPADASSGPVSTETVPEYPGLDALVAQQNVGLIYKLAPQFARLGIAEWQYTRQRLLQEFGKGLSVKNLDAAVKAEKFKLRKEVRENAALPQIVTTDRPLRDIVTDGLEALWRSNNPPHLFLRSGEMVRIAADEQARPCIQIVKESCLRGLMARSADYLKVTADGDKHIPPPIEAVRDIGSLRPDVLNLPPLAGVVEVPTLRPDGSVITDPGYDAQSGLFYAPPEDLQIPPVPDRPTADDVDGAVALMEEAIGDFPFENSSSRANAIGLLLTPIAKPALRGCVPLALLDAPQAGTGKSLFARLLAVIATGREAAMMPFPKKEEEMGKQIAASLSTGRPLVIFDNLEGNLSSPTLALALTAREFETRILGVSENMLVPNNATWLCTGNNIRPAGDMPRRCYHIRLDARSSRPFTGRKFRHPDLIAWATQNRARLLHSLLTIARYWYAQGCPQMVADPLGSFEDWHRTVGSILANAGIEGFLGNLDTFLSTADESQAEWEVFLRTLRDQYGDQTFTAARVASDIERIEEIKRALPGRLIEAAESKKSGGSFTVTIGHFFQRRRGVRFGDTGLYLDRKLDRKTKIAEWRVQEDRTTQTVQ